MALGLQARIPIGVWLVLYALTILGMISLGYHAGIAGSKWSKASLFLALSFAIMATMIASLDRPGGARVAQGPLVDLQGFIASGR